jgi:hypothetical protein
MNGTLIGGGIQGGIYHGRILLPPDYPFKPPTFMMLSVRPSPASLGMEGSSILRIIRGHSFGLRVLGSVFPLGRPRELNVDLVVHPPPDTPAERALRGQHKDLPLDISAPSRALAAFMEWYVPPLPFLVRPHQLLEYSVWNVNNLFGQL